MDRLHGGPGNDVTRFRRSLLVSSRRFLVTALSLSFSGLYRAMATFEATFLLLGKLIPMMPYSPVTSDPVSTEL